MICESRTSAAHFCQSRFHSAVWDVKLTLPLSPFFVSAFWYSQGQNANEPHPYASIVRTAASIFRNEGITAFWKGVVPTPNHLGHGRWRRRHDIWCQWAGSEMSLSWWPAHQYKRAPRFVKTVSHGRFDGMLFSSTSLIAIRNFHGQKPSCRRVSQFRLNPRSGNDEAWGHEILCSGIGGPIDAQW